MHSKKTGALFWNVLEVNFSSTKKNQNNFWSDHLLIYELLTEKSVTSLARPLPDDTREDILLMSI